MTATGLQSSEPPPHETPEVHPRQDGFTYLQEKVLTPENRHRKAGQRSLFLWHAIMQVLYNPQRGA